jgi:membrane protein
VTPIRLPAAIPRLVDRVLAWPPVVRLREILAFYDAAGGGLLAAGLAYSALFALLTGLLFAIGILGFFVNDTTTRESVVQWVTSQVPPLEPIVRDGLLSVAAHAGAFSILGLVGLGWSAGQFYGTLDTAVGRIFSTAPRRGSIDRIARGLVSVMLVVLVVLLGALATSLQALVGNRLPGGTDNDVWSSVASVALPALTALAAIVAVAIVYRVVPNVAVPLSALLPPAIVAGLGLSILTAAFVLLAPRLVGALEVFGSFAAVFAALSWLSLSCHVLLIGAVWTHERVRAVPQSA